MRRRAPRGLLLAAVLASWAGFSGCGSDAPPAPAVVFDIDGTLTPDAGDFIHARPDAARAVAAYSAKGYLVAYVTARPDALRDATRVWLAANGFPELPLYMPHDVLLFDRDVVAYKLNTLEQIMRDQNEVFRYAYGDSSTDFDAYNQAGVPVAMTFAMLRAHDTTCQPGRYQSCLPDYTSHLAYIESQPDARP
jgi:phosphatidate phosphatase PAH1